MEDEFEYFSMIGRGGSCTPTGCHTPELSPSMTRRAQSVRERAITPKRDIGIPQNLSVDSAERSRRNSVPGEEPNLLRVRNFQTGSRGIENKGDIVKASSSHCSLDSDSGSDGSGGNVLQEAASRLVTNTHRILLVGGDGVGKTALTQQFLTSDDVTDTDYSDDGREKFCTVCIDGEEAFLIFMDSDYDKNNYDPSSANAYIVVYSCTDRSSFEEAKGLLKNLRHFEKTKAIILCGNKSDLARKRQVSTEEGKAMAIEFDAGFIETSSTLNHKVDHLLVGILSQIKDYSRHRKSKSTKQKSKRKDFRKSVKGFVDKMIHRGGPEKSTKPDG